MPYMQRSKANRVAYERLMRMFSAHHPGSNLAPPQDPATVPMTAGARGISQKEGASLVGSDGVHDPPGSSATSLANFHNRLFSLLLRYKSIQGHGYQAAAGPPVFEVLKRRLGIGMECFASPLNAHFDRFASAFVDVDGPFGSCGSFFG